MVNLLNPLAFISIDQIKSKHTGIIKSYKYQNINNLK